MLLNHGNIGGWVMIQVFLQDCAIASYWTFHKQVCTIVRDLGKRLAF